LCGLTNPSTNSYRRLVPGYEAPVWFAYGKSNRSAAVRIPSYAAPEQRRMELRTPDATCNPYLAFAAMLMAGLDGVRRGLHAEEQGFGPHNGNLYAASADAVAHLRAAPRSLEEALQHLEDDHDYLLAGGVFNPSLIAQWIETKRRDCCSVRDRPHPHEFPLYYDL
jgi:glutamine synthetase